MSSWQSRNRLRADLWGILLAALLLGACGAPATVPAVAPATAPATVPAIAATPILTPAATATAASDTLVLTNGTLIDGTGAEPLHEATLVLVGSRIASLGKQDQVPIPAGARVVDVQGATILPGFINAHVHNAYSAANLEAWARAGVTTVRDEGILYGSSSLAELLAQRDSQWNEPQYARLVSAGWMISAPNGYGQLYVSSPAEAKEKVGEELAQGADLVKLAMEDGYGSRTDLPLLSAGELTAIVVAAHEQGALVSAHITEAGFLRAVVDAHVDDAAHMPWDPVPDELMQRMVAEQTYVVPTLTVMEAYGALEGSQANLQRFVAMGGQVALGNDYTNVPQNGFDHFELGMPMHEIQRMSEAGMSPMQILVAATRNAAHVCGLEKELGTLEPRKVADVLVVDGNPLETLEALTRVRLVIHDGIIIRDGG